MGSQQNTVDFIVEQISKAGKVAARRMFGEYGVFCDGKMVGLVCDDQLFIKPTAAGRRYIGEVTEGAPYKGAKPCFVISGETWEDGEWLTELVRVTALELPMPTPAKKRKLR